MKLLALLLVTALALGPSQVFARGGDHDHRQHRAGPYRVSVHFTDDSALEEITG